MRLSIGTGITPMGGGVLDSDIAKLREDLHFYYLHAKQTGSEAIKKIRDTWIERLTNIFAHDVPVVATEIERREIGFDPETGKGIYETTETTVYPALRLARAFVDYHAASVNSRIYKSELPRTPYFSSTLRTNPKF